MSEQANQTQQTPQAIDPVDAAIKAVESASQQETPKQEVKPVVAEAAKPAEPDKAVEEIKNLLSRDNVTSKQKREAADARAKVVEELKTKATSDRIGFLKELGLNPRDFAAELLLGHQPEAEEAQVDDVTKLKQELESIKAQLTEKEQAKQQELLQAQQQQALGSARQFLNEAGDKYEMIKAAGDFGAQVLVNALVAKYSENRDYYIENGTSPSFQDIAEGVNKYLAPKVQEHAKQQLEWIASQPALRGLLNNYAGKAQTPAPSPKPTNKPLSLDNDLAAEGVETATPKTAEERVQFAIKQLESQLKQAA